MIRVIVVGKTKESFYKEAIGEYLKRVSRFTKVVYEEVSKESLSKMKEGFVICLDVQGKSYSSEELASLIKKEVENPLIFYIGDETGLSRDLLSKSNLRLSFSRMTFPHELARVMLLEQIYRALTINKKLPYHK